MGKRFYFRDGQVWDGSKSLFHIHDSYEAAYAVASLNTQAMFAEEAKAELAQAHNERDEAKSEIARHDEMADDIARKYRLVETSSNTRAMTQDVLPVISKHIDTLQAENARMQEALEDLKQGFEYEAGGRTEHYEHLVTVVKDVIGRRYTD